ncbi:MAG: hypothetical protein WA623_00415 [Candidatus Sulfotelmatobacter sp.]
MNYVEGQVSVGDQQLDHTSVGNTTLAVGESLNTGKGKAEILLTPGVFLRAGDDTSVTMVAGGLTNTELRLTQGHVIVEVDQIYPQNNLRIAEGEATATMLKPGLYDFNLRQNTMRVFDGEATVQDGDRQIKLKAGRDLMLGSNASMRAVKFNKKEYEDGDLYSWSSLRSDYLAEANVDAAHIVLNDGWGAGWWGAGFWGPGWWGPGWGGWYWDPWFSAFTFVPGGGIFYSPFGWGFYSPVLVYRAPFYGGHYYHTFSATNVRAWGPGPHYATSGAYAHGIYNGDRAGRGGFHAGPAVERGGMRGGFSDGGFHGGGVARGGGFRGGMGR